MSRLGARLRRTLGEAHAVEPTPEPGLDPADLARYGRLRERAQAAARGELADAVTLEEAIGGHAVPTEAGDAWVVDTRLPLSALHGSRRLAAFYARGLGHLPTLMAEPRLADRLADEALFLDIEATGLSHGAGTHAFLVGLGFREGDDLVVRQLLMRDPSDERAALQLLVERLDQHPLLVSFNGKSYDLTVLQTRLVIQRFYTRRDCDLKARPHLDLLHLGRNLYRGRWPDVRLGTLERQVLGFERVDDVPGHLVPSCWFHYLRTGDAGPLAGVMLHNLHDVVSMVTLADRLVADGVPEVDPTRDPHVTANLARLLDRRGRPGQAADLLTRWLEDDHRLDDELLASGLALLARAARRSGDPQRQGEALDRLVAVRPRDPAALAAAATFAERSRRDLQAALGLAQQALDAKATDGAIRRVERLERRLARASAGKTRAAPLR